MTFLIIFIALVLERFLHVGQYLYRFSCFNAYVLWLRSFFAKYNLWYGFLGVAITVIPLLLLVVILFAIFHGFWHRTLYYLISLLILLYCLGPEDFNIRLNQFFRSNSLEDSTLGFSNLKGIVPADAISSPYPLRFLTLAIFNKFNENLFAVLFWFVVLGPFGAVLYRSIDLLSNLENEPAGIDTSFQQAATCCKEILDWLPLRLLALGYALVGDFQPTFKLWLAKLFSEPKFNQQFIGQAGMYALNIDAEHPEIATIEENKLAVELVERTLIVYLVILALVTIAILI